MSSTPLILYRAGSLDAAAAKELLLERFPGAVAIGGELDMNRRDEVAAAWHQAAHVRKAPVYLLGLGTSKACAEAKGRTEVGIDPTPDASMAMQVWAILDFCASTPCQHYPTGCRLCEHRGEYRCAESGKDAAPTWLRYLDLAVRGKIEDDSEDSLMWVAVQSYPAELQLGQLRRGWENETYRSHLMSEGDAILRARKRWEKEAEATLAVAAVAGFLGADMFEMVRRERDQLRADVQALRKEIKSKTRHCHHFGPISRFCYHLDRCVEDEEMPTGRVHAENDKLRTKLREALDHLYNPEAVAEMSREEWLEWWRPACELAGVGDPTPTNPTKERTDHES